MSARDGFGCVSSCSLSAIASDLINLAASGYLNIYPRCKYLIVA